MEKPIRSFRDLNIWQKGMEIARAIYAFSSELPKEEQYGMVSQMRRAAISLPSNIAEGFRRRNQKEFRQFLHISLGSAAELETQIELCRDFFNLDQNSIEKLLSQLNFFQAMTMVCVSKVSATPKGVGKFTPDYHGLTPMATCLPAAGGS